jgi:hypothetical protein
VIALFSLENLFKTGPKQPLGSCENAFKTGPKQLLFLAKILSKLVQNSLVSCEIHSKLVQNSSLLTRHCLPLTVLFALPPHCFLLQDEKKRHRLYSKNKSRLRCARKRQSRIDQIETDNQHLREKCQDGATATGEAMLCGKRSLPMVLVRPGPTGHSSKPPSCS